MQFSERGERSVVLVGDLRFKARGRAVSSEDVDGGGKTKSNAMPASEELTRNGKVRRSAPRAISFKTSCGVAGSLNRSRGRVPKGSGMMDRLADSYRASPETKSRNSSCSSSRYSNCCVFSNGRIGAKYAVFERSSTFELPYNRSVVSLVCA